MQIKTKEGVYTVLVVDDDVDSLEKAAALIREMGFRTDTATGGKQAVQLCQTHHYNLILMDVDMPVVNGHATTRDIRSLPGPISHTRIVALLDETMTDKRHVEDCLKSGMNDCLRKPLDAETLKKRFFLWLQHKNKSLKIRC